MVGIEGVEEIRAHPFTHENKSEARCSRRRNERPDDVTFPSDSHG